MSECGHKSVIPKWDAEDARHMTSDEVRTKYPRFYGQCPECKQTLVLYASFEQYVAGDY